MAENFDIGPLTWVKDEINQSLDKVLEHLAAVQSNMDDTSPLRFAQTHLYQASGALDMVGLEGCKRFCNELEILSAKLEKNERALSQEVLDIGIKAIKTLKYYIQELLNGAPDIPLRLYPALNSVVTARGETLDESELFFPDTSNSAPKDLPSEEFSDEAYVKFIAEQRVQYQKSLLNWLQAKNSVAAESMREAVSNVTLAQHKSAAKTFWWVSTAFTETLELPAIAENAAAKKLCRRLDQELRQLAEGSSKPPHNLLRDMLYFVAISEVDRETAKRVKAVFLLDDYIDRQSSVHATAETIGENELTYVEQLKPALEVLREIWDEVSNSIDFNKVDVDDDHSMVDVNNVLMTKFADKLYAMQEVCNKLSQVAVVDLFAALRETSEVLRDNLQRVTYAALIEVAAALHILDSALSHYERLDNDNVQNLVSEIERLQAIASGTNYEKLADDRNNQLDIATIVAVVGDIKESLKIVEQALDTYFRNPTDKSILRAAAAPLKKVAATFDMLNLSSPTQVVQLAARLMDHFQTPAYVGSQSDFELEAEALSMVGMYAEEIPRVRPELEQGLEETLVKLQAALTVYGVDGEDALPEKTQVEASADAPAAVAAVVSESNQDTTVQESAFDEELQDIYLTEAEEVLAHIAENLQALKVNPKSEQPVIEVRRSYHTLKGSGRTVGLNALGEVAAKVEYFLNGVLDKKQHLNPSQIAKIEAITAQFAEWANELRTNGSVQVQTALWIEKVAALAQAEEDSIGDAEKTVGSASAKKADSDAEVMIGNRKLSRAFYEIFINESMRNVTLLEQDVNKVSDKKTVRPSKQAKHAVHTLASNALATGFTAMGELCRALEHWLDEVVDDWNTQHLPVYANVVKTISSMWQKASELKNPRSANALVKLLNEATDKAKQHREENGGDAAKPGASGAKLDEALMEDIAETEPIEAAASVEMAELEVNEAANDEMQTVQAIEQEVVEQASPGEAVPASATPSELPAANIELEPSEVDQELLTLFIDEAHEILPEIGFELRSWRANPKSTTHPEALQRGLHTLKGSARMASQIEIGDIAHGFEERVVRAQRNLPTAADFEHMFNDLDSIAAFFENTLEDAPEDIAKVVSPEAAQPMGRASDRKSQYLRMRADALDRLINEAGEVSIIRSRIDRELVGFKQSSSELTESLTRLRGYLRELEIEAETQMQSRMNVLQESNESFDPLEFDRFTRLQELTRMIAESVNDVATIQGGLLSNLGNTEAALQQQGRMNRDLQQGLMNVRMLPFKQIADRMRRIVRQTARELFKSADLVISGEDTEIDRSVLDKMGAPLEHLLRNAVAHGIESPEERKKHGKPEMGTIQMDVRIRNDEIHLKISDDGAGINLKKVRDRAVKRKLISKDAEVTEQGLLEIIFEPGFSTADQVSQIAGRGVGLDVVRNDISALGGRVDLSTEADKGTTFHIYLPVTQTVAQVLMVRAASHVYAIPVAMIEQAQKIKKNDLASIYVTGEVEWNKAKYPIHHLARILGLQDHQFEDTSHASVLLLRSGAHTVALHVDEVLGNEEVVLKPIGAQLTRVPGIVGATVAGDGQIVLLLNPVQVANREILSSGSVTVKAVKQSVVQTVQRMRALVVDDSLTMRKVLGRLLEREGYDILLAKDGMDAIQILQENTPDIILTDIEMPRMDGFGLSRNIRSDERTAHTPLIMISSRTADKHQSLAKEIGVDAFFGKPVNDEELIAKMRDLISRKP